MRKIFIALFILTFPSLGFSKPHSGTFIFTLSESNHKPQLLVKKQLTGKTKTIRLHLADGPFFHWGNRSASKWIEQTYVSESDLRELIEKEKSGATGGGLYTTTVNPFETEEYGNILMVVTPPRPVRAIKEKDWEALLEQIEGSSEIERMKNLNIELGKSGIEAIVQASSDSDIKSWYCFINSKPLKVRAPTLQDVQTFAWFEETSSGKGVLSAFLKFYLSGQIDVLKLSKDRFPIFLKAIQRKKLLASDLQFIAETIVFFNIDLEKLADRFYPNDPLDEAIQKALKKYSPKEYKTYKKAVEGRPNRCGLSFEAPPI